MEGVSFNIPATNSNLKPCPFCGDTYISFYYRNGKHRIGCQSLGCVCLHTQSNGFNSEEVAIAAWERRI